MISKFSTLQVALFQYLDVTQEQYKNLIEIISNNSEGNILNDALKKLAEIKPQERALFPLFDNACCTYTQLVKDAILEVVRTGTDEEKKAIQQHLTKSSREAKTESIKAEYEGIIKLFHHGSIETKSSHDFLSEAHADIKFTLFSFLKINDLLRLAQTSQHLNAFISVELAQYIKEIETPKIVTTEFISGLKKTKKLNLVLSNVTLDNMRLVGQLMNLQSLDLQGKAITEAELKYLCDMTNLRSLNLRRTTITDAGLQHLVGMTNLQSLNLRRTMLSDAALQYLSSMTNLQSLDLGGTKITEAGLPYLSGLTNLRSLNLDETVIKEAGLQYLSSLKNLESLSLGCTTVTEVKLNHLSSLPNLQSLDLGGAKVTESALKYLNNLPNLRWLNLRMAKVTGTRLEPLSSLTNLRSLDLTLIL